MLLDFHVRQEEVTERLLVSVAGTQLTSNTLLLVLVKWVTSIELNKTRSYLRLVMVKIRHLVRLNLIPVKRQSIH